MVRRKLTRIEHEISRSRRYIKHEETTEAKGSGNSKLSKDFD